jgi:hypothetical protein
MYEYNEYSHLKNIPRGLNDADLRKAILKRIDDIDTSRRSIKTQLNIATANNKRQKIKELSLESNILLKERFALNNEYKLVNKKIKRYHRDQKGAIPESLAIEFMLIAQKKLPDDVFAKIRDEASMNIACYKS